MGKKKQGFSKPTVPPYLVSFGALMTILLTFFILLCTYATSKSSGFISDGIGSFRSAIDSLGLPGLMPGTRQPIDVGADRIGYQSKDREDKGERDRDARRITDERESLRNARVKELRLGEQLRLEIAIRFVPGTADLEPGYEKKVRSISGIVAASGRRVEVIGHADREHLAPLDGMRLAMRRAVRVVDLLENEFGAPASELTAGAAAGSRAHAIGSIPEGDITLRVYRPDRRGD